MKKLCLLFLFLFMILPTAGCSRTSIALPSHYSDFFKFNDITYGIVSHPTIFAKDHILTFYDTVKRKNDLAILNGDAEGFEAGTPVYILDDYAPSFRLVVKQDSEILIFQAHLNPHATKAGDMMDIGGRVKRISVHDPDKYKEIASITDQEQINKLVGLFLEAPYSNEVLMNPGTKAVTIRFYLADGTETGGFLWLDSGVYGSFIQLPEEFCSSIRNIIIEQQTKP
jgi:hypothetical protein